MSMAMINAPDSSEDRSRRLYLGIDSGGTNTRALLTDETGTVLGHGYAGSANPNHYSAQQVGDNLGRAICGALRGQHAHGDLASVFLGSSGVSTESDRAGMRAILRGLKEVAACPNVAVGSDTLIGLTGGLTGRPGMVLIAGTGSACYGKNAAGQELLCGGWGALADDIGSAPWIGIRAINAAVLAQDGRIPETALRDIAFAFLELGEPRDLIHRLHNQGLDRAEIGKLAPLVIQAYADGDAAAAAIVHEAASGLADLVRATRNRLFAGAECELILVGGLALSGPPFQPLLLEQIQAAAPGVLPREPELSPVQGAVLEAMRADGTAWNAATIANLNARAMHV